MAIRVQCAAFDPGAEVNAMQAANVGVGAVVSFVGYVRDFNDGLDVSGMFLEHYPGMTEKALGKIALEAEQRWPLLKLEVLHRIGALEPGSRSSSSGPPVPIARRRSTPAPLSWTTSRPVHRSGRKKTPATGRGGWKGGTVTMRRRIAGSGRSSSSSDTPSRARPLPQVLYCLHNV